MKLNDLYEALDCLIPNPVCELEYSKDYELLIAVMLSAQTTDKRVNMVTKILFSKYSTLENLYSADIADLMNIIRPIGTFNKKASNIISISKSLINPIMLFNLSFKLILNSDYYEKQNGLWIDKSEDEDYMKNKIANAESIKVVGIIRQNEQSAATAMNSGIGYNKELKEYVINKSNEAEIVKEQKADVEINVFSG